MPTLWQIWTGQAKKPEPLEMSFYNPYRIRVGNTFSIDHLDYENLRFRLRNIRQIKRRIGGQTFVHGDYNLLANPLSGEPVNVMLRMIPKADSTDHDIILLVPNAEYGVGLPDVLGYNDYLAAQNELSEAEKDRPQLTQSDFIFQKEHIDWFLNESLAKLEFSDVDADGHPMTYYRVNDHAAPWEAEIAIVEDDNSDGIVKQEEIDYRKIQYWDYWTEIEEHGNKVIEWLIVENDHGYITFWKGRMIDSVRITVD